MGDDDDDVVVDFVRLLLLAIAIVNDDVVVGKNRCGDDVGRRRMRSFSLIRMVLGSSRQ